MEPAGMTRQRIGSGTPDEATVGYSRAVRVGPAVVVSGTSALKDGVLVGRGDAAAQTRQVLANIAWALGEAGATSADVVRYRVDPTEIGVWSEVATELSRGFGEVRPANLRVAVAALVAAAMPVEIEADAVVGSAARP